MNNAPAISAEYIAQMQAEMLAQMQTSQAQNELLKQRLAQQQEILNVLQSEQANQRISSQKLEQVIMSTVQATQGSFSRFQQSSSKSISSRPFSVPEYDGMRGQAWRTFKSKLLNELKRPNSSSRGSEYAFLYSKATGDFCQYLNAQNFEGLEFHEVLEVLDKVFQGTAPRLEALRVLEELVKKGTSLAQVRQYFYDFQNNQRQTGLIAKDLYETFMMGFIDSNVRFTEANFANPYINYMPYLNDSVSSNIFWPPLKQKVGKGAQ